MLHKTIFAIAVGGTPRVLFSVYEDQRQDRPDKYGEITLVIEHAEQFGFHAGVKTLQQKYSIHPTSGSADYTMLKHTVITDDGGELSSVALTDAIKKKSGYAAMYYRRCPNLNNARYEFDPSEKDTSVVVVGSYDPANWTLSHAVLVAHQDAELPERKGCITTARNFLNCKIVVLHSICAYFSGTEGLLIHGVTLRPETAPDATEKELRRSLMNGHSAEFISAFYLCAEAHMNLMHIDKLLRVPLTVPQLAHLLRLRTILGPAREEFLKRSREGQPEVAPPKNRKPSIDR